MATNSNHRDKILKYISRVGIATRNDISTATGLTGRTLTETLGELVREGVLELIEEKPKTYKFIALREAIIDFQDIQSYYEMKMKIFKELINSGWRLAPGYHEVAVAALTYSKYTQFRTLIFGSQGVGKTSAIKATFYEIKSPLIVEDLHLMNLYDVVYSIKNNTKVCEQQYRHRWGYENPAKFDRYQVIPLSRIAPSELIFRFIPVRVIQPTTSPTGDFRQIYFRFTNVPRPRTPQRQEILALNEQLSHYEYFTLDNDTHKQAAELIKYDEVMNFTDDSLDLHKANLRYELKVKNDVLLANWKEIWDMDFLYMKFTDDLQIWNNALQVLQFNLSWLRDEDKAVEQTVDFILDMFKTFTIVRQV
ncbi:hypothetical protein [Thermococcus sp.]